MILRDDYNFDFELKDGMITHSENTLTTINKIVANENPKSTYSKKWDTYGFLRVSNNFIDDKKECEKDYVSKNTYITNEILKVKECEKEENAFYFEYNGFYIVCLCKNYIVLNEKPLNVVLHEMSNHIYIETCNNEHYIFNGDCGTIEQVELVKKKIIKK